MRQTADAGGRDKTNMKNKKQQPKPETSKRPPGVTVDLETQIKLYVHRNYPMVVDPALTEASGSNTGLFRLPVEIINGHVQRRRKQGATEAAIDVELDYLLEYFKKCCGEFGS
jgi:hypothetical protein